MAQTEKYGRMAMKAIENHNLQELKHWLNIGAQPSQIYANGKTLLGVSAEHGDFNTFKLLLDIQEFNAMTTFKSLETFVAQQDLHKRDIFNYAFMGGQSDIVEYLLNNFKCFDANYHKSYELSLLEIAIQNGYEDIVKILLKRGAIVDSFNQEKQTPIHIAAKMRNVEIIKILILHGARLNVVDVFNYSPLCYSVALADEESCRVLIENKIDYDLGRVDRYYKVLEKAFWNQMIEIVRMLFRHGDRFEDSTCFFHVAVSIHKNFEMVKLLHQVGADLNCKDFKGETPLTVSIYYNGAEHEITKYLISHGATV